jgi:hypothetical protein
MTKTRKRRRPSAESQGPDRQPTNLDHRKGHRSFLRAGLPELYRGSGGGGRPLDRGMRSQAR